MGQQIKCHNCPYNYFCCTLKVHLSWPEIIKIYLQGHKNFWEKINHKKSLKMEDGDCIFLDRKKGRCKIYPFRPKQCRAFPFDKGVKKCSQLLKSFTKKNINGTQFQEVIFR